MNWWRKLLSVNRAPAAPAPIKSTRRELVVERRLRKNEHDRTERLARVLADYRQQDHYLGR